MGGWEALSEGVEKRERERQGAPLIAGIVMSKLISNSHLCVCAQTVQLYNQLTIQPMTADIDKRDT